MQIGWSYTKDSVGIKAKKIGGTLTEVTQIYQVVPILFLQLPKFPRADWLVAIVYRLQTNVTSDVTRDRTVKPLACQKNNSNSTNHSSRFFMNAPKNSNSTNHSSCQKNSNSTNHSSRFFRNAPKNP